jgi:hypothetical protein
VPDALVAMRLLYVRFMQAHYAAHMRDFQVLSSTTDLRLPHQWYECPPSPRPTAHTDAQVPGRAAHAAAHYLPRGAHQQRQDARSAAATGRGRGWPVLWAAAAAGARGARPRQRPGRAVQPAHRCGRPSPWGSGTPDTAAGEEQRDVEGAQHTASTVEMAALDRPVDVAVLDEIQARAPLPPAAC